MFGRYPSCDHVNNAIRLIMKGELISAIEELSHAIIKADGYFYDDIPDAMKEYSNDLNTLSRLIKTNGYFHDDIPDAMKEFSKDLNTFSRLNKED